MNNFLVFIVSLIIAAAIGMYWWFSYYKPFTETKESKQQMIKSLERELDENQDIDQEIANSEKTKRELTEKINMIKGWFRNKGKISVILEKFEKYAKKNHLKMKDIRFPSYVEEQNYSTLKIEISFEGLYHDLGKFLADMENQKIVNMNDAVINLTPRGQPKFNKFKYKKNKKKKVYDLVELSINVSVNAYFIHEDKGGSLGG